MKTNFQMLMELKDYSPANEFVTSSDEIKRVTETLHLDEMDVLALRNLRDFVVLYYENKKTNSKNNNSLVEVRDGWEAMQSITTIIDHKIWEIGGEI